LESKQFKKLSVQTQDKVILDVILHTGNNTTYLHCCPAIIQSRDKTYIIPLVWTHWTIQPYVMVVLCFIQAAACLTLWWYLTW